MTFQKYNPSLAKEYVGFLLQLTYKRENYLQLAVENRFSEILSTGRVPIHFSLLSFVTPPKYWETTGQFDLFNIEIHLNSFHLN